MGGLALENSIDNDGMGQQMLSPTGTSTGTHMGANSQVRFDNNIEGQGVSASASNKNNKNKNNKSPLDADSVRQMADAALAGSSVGRRESNENHNRVDRRRDGNSNSSSKDIEDEDEGEYPAGSGVSLARSKRAANGDRISADEQLMSLQEILQEAKIKMEQGT